MKEVQQILHELKLQIARCGISVFGVFTPPAELRGQQRRLATWQDISLHSIDACLPLLFQVVEIIYYSSEFAWQGPVFNLTPAQVKFVRARGEGRAVFFPTSGVPILSSLLRNASSRGTVHR